uniref:Chitin-binding type-2 domain-containing protein n=1 Tax=Musca domestica TaxID=7370 RepID=A0A1I8MIG6_MUSDO
MFCGFLLVCLLTVLIIANAANVPRYVSHKNCNNVKSGRIIAHPDNCSQYIVCNGLRSTLGECPEGLYYNPEMLSCDKMKTHCRSKETMLEMNATSNALEPNKDKTPAMLTTKQPPTTTTTMAPTTPFIPLYADGRPLCSLWQDVEFPHPYKCSFYYKCFKGFLIIRKCRHGHIWDWIDQRCVPEPLGQCYAQKNALKMKSTAKQGEDGYVRMENEILMYFLKMYFENQK